MSVLGILIPMIGPAAPLSRSPRRVPGHTTYHTSRRRPGWFPFLPPTNWPARPALFLDQEPLPYLFPVPSPASPESASTSPSIVRFAPCPPTVGQVHQTPLHARESAIPQTPPQPASLQSDQDLACNRSFQLF